MDEIITADRAEALDRLIEAVAAWARSPSSRGNTPEEDQLVDALRMVKHSGTDNALRVWR